MTNNTKTCEAHPYYANRREAGRVIDIETCDMDWWHTYFFDLYRIYPHNDDPPDNELNLAKTGGENERSEEIDGCLAVLR